MLNDALNLLAVYFFERETFLIRIPFRVKAGLTEVVFMLFGQEFDLVSGVQRIG